MPCPCKSPGIIPAYAGNTIAARVIALVSGDHPRVCGEHRNPTRASTAHPGSSPRMRGTHTHNSSIPSSFGIIPAYAGNTCSRPSCRRSWRDHPRVCGEHLSNSAFAICTMGSSPRMRGTPLDRIARNATIGIIPAYAGNTTVKMTDGAESSGSSPRMRGTRVDLSRHTSRLGIIPAYAGNTLKNPSSESRNPIIELHFNQFAKKVKRCFAIRFRPMRCFIFKVQ